MKFCPVEQKLCLCSIKKKGVTLNEWRNPRPEDFYCLYKGIEMEFKDITECPKKG